MNKTIRFAAAFCALTLCCSTQAWSWGRKTVIKVGLNAPMTGDIPKVGEGSKYAAEMWLEDVKKAGGIEVDGKKYPVELVVEDNDTDRMVMTEILSSWGAQVTEESDGQQYAAASCTFAICK